VMVEHFVDGIGYRSFQRNSRNFAVAKFQHVHSSLLVKALIGEIQIGEKFGLMNYARAGPLVKKKWRVNVNFYQGCR
jgi:hypothetical protein